MFHRIHRTDFENHEKEKKKVGVISPPCNLLKLRENLSFYNSSYYSQQKLKVFFNFPPLSIDTNDQNEAAGEDGWSFCKIQLTIQRRRSRREDGPRGSVS